MAAALGQDPSGERKAQRDSMTMAQLCDEYVADMEAGRVNGKKESTIKSDKSRIAAHIMPVLGKRKVSGVTQEDAEQFMRDLPPGSARRVTGLLGAIFSYSVKRKLRPDNPVHGLDKPAEVKKLRRLSDAEYAQLWRALENGDNAASDVFLLLAVSGWRSSEAKNLKWSEVDLERKVAALGDTKTGVSVRPLSSAAVDIIQRQAEEGPVRFRLPARQADFQPNSALEQATYARRRNAAYVAPLARIVGGRSWSTRSHNLRSARPRPAGHNVPLHAPGRQGANRGFGPCRQRDAKADEGLTEMAMLDDDQLRIAEAVRAGNRASMNDASWLFASYFIYKWIFAVTTPVAFFSAIAIGVHTNAYWGWGLLIAQQLLCVSFTKTGLLLTFVMLIWALSRIPLVDQRLVG
jgi:site-specific recombinase XerD